MLLHKDAVISGFAGGSGKGGGGNTISLVCMCVCIYIYIYICIFINTPAWTLLGFRGTELGEAERSHNS